MLLDSDPHFKDQSLTGLGEQLGERKRGDSLDDGCEKDRQDDGNQKFRLPSAHHIVDEVLGADRQGQAADAVDDHEPSAHQQELPARFHERPHLG